MIIELNGKRPIIGNDVYLAPNAVIAGDIIIGEKASIWFGAVIRGDEGKISIGPRTSVQDNVVIHVNAGSNTIVEADVTLAHGVVIEGCHIEKGAFVGMNATVLSGARIGQYAFVAAGSVVLENQKIPANYLAAGVPSKIIKPISESLKDRIAQAPSDYMAMSNLYYNGAKIISQ
jgi:carbonic anhydrase/acetyltransferase-like protein (isoleucine patch superfamily)